MARGNKSSEGRAARTESNPYGGAEYRANEAARSGSNTLPTMKDVRSDLNSNLAKVAGLVDYAKEIKEFTGSESSSKNPLLERFNDDVGDVQWNSNLASKLEPQDAFSETIDKLSTFVAFRDKLEILGVKKSVLANLDRDIVEYAGSAEKLYNALDDNSTSPLQRERAIVEYNDYALACKDAIRKSIKDFASSENI